MKRFIFKCFIFFVLLAGLYIIMIIFMPQNKEGYLEEYNKKIEKLQKSYSPRIIFVGGSTLVFGIDSKKIHEEFGYDVVNMGLHSGLGLYWELEDIYSYLRPGDIVFISPVYTQFFGNAYGNITLLSLQFISRGTKLHLLNRYQIEESISNLPKLFKNSVEGRISQIKNGNNERIYRSDVFNSYGDFNKFDSIPNQPFDYLKTTSSAQFDNEFFAYFLRKLKAMSQICNVYLLPPPAYTEYYDAVSDQVSFLLEKLNQNDVDYLVAPSKCVFEGKHMFDSEMHLNSYGRDRYTNMLISAMKYNKIIDKSINK